MKTKEKPVKIWYKLLSTALKLPGTVINRADFIKQEFENYCTEEEISKAIELNPQEAGIKEEIIERVAKSVIRWETYELTGMSFLAGLPGGFLSAVSIPADIIQFYTHQIIIIQKLAYLYGWKQLVDKSNIKDEKTLLKLTMFYGVMYGAKDAENLLQKLESDDFSDTFFNGFEEKAIYKAASQIGKWFGVRLIKSITKQGTAKIIPILGGFISGGVSYVAAKSGTKKLHEYMKNISVRTVS